MNLKLKDLTGLALIDALMLLPDNLTFSVGALSAYVFIGSKKEWTAWSYSTLFNARKVRDAYRRMNPKDGIIILVEGLEQGKYWNEEETKASPIKLKTLKGRNGESEHDVFCTRLVKPEPDDEVYLHRFEDKYRCAYSAIFLNGVEVVRAKRIGEYKMIEKWNKINQGELWKGS